MERDKMIQYKILFLGILLFFLALSYFAYYYLPTKKIFFIFLALILSSLGMMCYLLKGPVDRQMRYKESKMQVLTEQPIFATWYEGYKKNLIASDHIWSLYNDTLDDFSLQHIGLEIFRQRLIEIKKQEDELVKRTRPLLPPGGLSDTNYKLCFSILQKYNSFVAKEQRCIDLTLQAAKDSKFEKASFPVQVATLKKVRVLQNPIFLNTAAEVVAIRNNLEAYPFGGK